MKENLFISLENKKQAKKWRNISLILLCITLILFLNQSEHNELSTKVKERNKASIAEITIENEIKKDEYRSEIIGDIINNDKIKGVIINIDSPGGMVTPSEDLYNLISKLNKTKPTVILMQSMATSGGYMISLGADYIIAKNTTLTGSIGVLLQSFELTKLAKNIGINLKTFKSSELKGMPSLFEKNTKNSNLTLQSSLDDVYDFFKNLVKTKRPNMTAKNLELATNGQVFTGRQALKIGLIDEVGDKSSALKYLKSKNVNIELPIVKIELKKKIKTNLLQKFTTETLLNFIEISDFKIKKDNGFMSIYNTSQTR